MGLSSPQATAHPRALKLLVPLSGLTLIWSMLAVLGNVTGAVAAVTPVLRLFAVPGKVPYPVAFVALFCMGANKPGSGKILFR